MYQCMCVLCIVNSCYHACFVIDCLASSIVCVFLMFLTHLLIMCPVRQGNNYFLMMR